MSKFDLILPRGKEQVLKAEDKDYDRGLLVELLSDGGYEVAYWYDKEEPYPIEVLVDGQSIKKDAKKVTFKFHPKMEDNRINEVYKDSGLGKWFGKGGKGGTTKGGWDRYNTKGEKIGKCGDAKESEGKPKCLSAEKAAKMTKKEIANAVKRKRKKDPDTDRPGTGNKPINVSNRIKNKKKKKTLKEWLLEGKRIPKTKKNQDPDTHSDLYTDENPKGTIHGLKFATETDARKSVKKIENSGKKHAHKIQAAIAMEQRAKAADKTAPAKVYRTYIEKMKRKTKEMNENNIFSFGEYLTEKTKNVPTNPELWSRAKSAAKKKFDVYPSAYANAWASKWYKKRGGGWKKKKS